MRKDWWNVPILPNRELEADYGPGSGMKMLELELYFLVKNVVRMKFVSYTSNEGKGVIQTSKSF